MGVGIGKFGWVGVLAGVAAVFGVAAGALGQEVAAEEDLGTVLKREMARSAPDYVVYVPKSLDGSTHDTGNEHFLVFDGPDGSLMAVWTQSSHEGAGDHRIVFARSEDEGVTWTPPLRIVGPEAPSETSKMSSWGFPLISKSGRIYVVWNQERGPADVHRQFSGSMDCAYSDDFGKTWSAPQTIPMPKGRWDDPREEVYPNWIVWQKPIRDLEGKWFTGYSHWVSKARRHPPHVNSWTEFESVIEFMRFENIDENPEPRDIRLTFSAWGDDALRVPHYSNPILSIAQEPSLVRLPDDRLFCVMRTMSGYIWYSLSADDGRTWCAPRPLLRRDHGEPVLQPLCCCPIYSMGNGRYVLLHHNNDGRFEGSKPEETNKNRRPAFIALGEYRADAEQPIWFSDSKELMDNEGAQIGPLKRIDIGVYPSVTQRKGKFVLWHPERKFFLLGKIISDEWLADLTVPGE